MLSFSTMELLFFLLFGKYIMGKSGKPTLIHFFLKNLPCNFSICQVGLVCNVCGVYLMILFPVLLLNLWPSLETKVSVCIPETQDVAKTGLKLEVLMPQPISCMIVWIVYEHICVPACCVFSEYPEQDIRCLLTHSLLHFFESSAFLLNLKLAWRLGRFSSPCFPQLNMTKPSFLCGCWHRTLGLHSKRFEPIVPSQHLLPFCIFSSEGL